MIKNFSEFKKQKNNGKLNALLKNDIEIYEKLNTYYFNIKIINNDIKLFKSNGKEIDLTEQILNKMWDDPIKDFNYFPTDLNNVNIGLYYIPTSKPISTDYSNLFNISKYYFNTCYDLKTKEKINFDIASYYNIPKIKPIFKGKISLKTFKDINLYINNKLSEIELVKSLTGGNTFSNNDIENIEGIVIKSNKKLYQITINNNESLDISEQQFYYDMFITDFINYVNTNNIDNLIIKNDYVKSVSNIFIDYLNKSNFIKNYIIEPSNLEFPHIGYYPGLNLDLLDNDNVKTICLANKLYKNMFTILLSGLRHTKNSNKHSRYITNYHCNIWNNLYKKINE